MKINLSHLRRIIKEEIESLVEAETVQTPQELEFLDRLEHEDAKKFENLVGIYKNLSPAGKAEVAAWLEKQKNAEVKQFPPEDSIRSRIAAKLGAKR